MDKMLRIAALSLFVIGCDNPPPTQSSPQPESPPPQSSGLIATTSLRIDAPPSLVRGQSGKLAATLIDGSGNAIDVSGHVTWSSSNLLVLSAVDGSLFAIGAGTATVTATLDDDSASVDIAVVPRVLTALTMVAEAESAPVGAARTVALTASYNDGSVVDVGADARWSTSDATIATVSAAGGIVAVAPGMATVAATFDGQVAAVPFLVTPAPPSQPEPTSAPL